MNSPTVPSEALPSDGAWMDRALRLAALADGGTSPNPLVGAVVLDARGQLVAEGFHRRAGEPHAEALALARAGERARGGTLVVTLEPCCHHGRTPPCTDAVLAAAPARVVVAMADPDPRVAGRGLERLRAAGLTVVEGVRRPQALRLNSAFVHRVQQGRPEGWLKWAASADGRTALPNGASQWISGAPARDWVHGLRSRCDAVIVGGGTLRADNPLLTSRARRDPEPLRVVLSRHLNLPRQAQLWDLSVAPTLVAHGPEADGDCLAWLEALGIEMLPLPVASPLALLQALAARGCNRVLWECGPALAAAALRQGCVQQLALVQAPLLLGGAAARTALGDLGLEDLAAAPRLQDLGLTSLGNDRLWRLALPSPPSRRPEPELMEGDEQAAAYAAADFSVEDGALVDRFAVLAGEAWGDGQGRAVLDLGCGPGNICERLARRWPAARVLGLDGAAAMLAIAEERRRRADPPLVGLAYRQVTFPLDPMATAALRAEGPWAAVVSNSVLHHLHEPAVFWQTLRDLAPPAALLLLRDLRRPADEDQRRALVQRHAASAPAVLRHDFAASLAAAFTPAEVEAQLLQAGLTGLQVRPLGDRHLEVWGPLP